MVVVINDEVMVEKGSGRYGDRRVRQREERSYISGFNEGKLQSYP